MERKPHHPPPDQTTPPESWEKQSIVPPGTSGTKYSGVWLVRRWVKVEVGRAYRSGNSTLVPPRLSTHAPQFVQSFTGEGHRPWRGIAPLVLWASGWSINFGPRVGSNLSP
jgi:hypothetical protein